MTTRPITPKQKKLLEFIREHSASHGYAPSQQEIADRFGYRSLGTVQNYLVRLERQGFLRKEWNARRALEVVDSGAGDCELPLLGRVAAGRPIEAVAGNDAIDVPRSMITPGECFALKVVGDSMIGDGILDGDYVIVRRRATAENGQTVVALVDGAATVKRLYRRGGAVELRPANPAVASLFLDEGQDLQIAGVVVGVIRHCVS